MWVQCRCSVAVQGLGALSMMSSYGDAARPASSSAGRAAAMQECAEAEAVSMHGKRWGALPAG